jgi:hypothetical protein
MYGIAERGGGELLGCPHLIGGPGVPIGGWGHLAWMHHCVLEREEHIGHVVRGLAHTTPWTLRSGENEEKLGRV